MCGKRTESVYYQSGCCRSGPIGIHHLPCYHAGYEKLGIRNRCRIHEIPDHIEYIVAKPRMQLYMEYSARIYGIYLNYVAKEDIHVYSVDECFMDVTRYLSLYHLTAKEMAQN